MSGSKSHKNAAKQQPPSSLRETLERKFKIAERAGNPLHSHARNSVASRNKVPYYESPGGHHPYDSHSAMYTYLIRGDQYESWAKPTKRDYIPVPPSRTGGPVGPDIDWSVRARNMPIIFIKQMKHMAVHISFNGRKVYQDYFNILFTNREFVPPNKRPKVGCSPTFHWTDHQVKTWTKLAHYIGVHYHGKRDYTFPKGTLGKAVKGSYYRENKPWPLFRSDGTDHMPFFPHPPKVGRKRSEFARISRALSKVHKGDICPIDVSKVLLQRRVLPRKRINRLYHESDRTVSAREFREAIPYCLSVSIGPPMQVSPIVRRALRNMFSRVTKFEPVKSWFTEEPVKAPITFPIPPNRKVAGRLMASYCGDGRYYITRSKNDNRAAIRNGHDPDKVIRDLDEINDFIDGHSEDEVYDQYGYSGLGDW
jgi:hypothetical protein